LMLSDRFVAATTAVSLRTGMPKINRPDLTAIPILLPPLAEQKRIAEVLGVWDRAIAVAGQQLDLARTQKRALMQTLLTPTRRFPGFDGQPWKEVRLGDVGLISSAGVDKKTNPAEPEVRLLNFLDVFRRDFLYDKEFDHVVTAPAAKLEQCNVQKGDVFFTPSSETRDDLARSAVAMEDMPGVVYSYHVVRLRLTEDWDMNFRAFVFQSDRFQRQAYEKGDGSGQRYVISQSNFRDMTVFVPGKEEQALIGATLKAAADEITALETQITRLQAEKKALMQQLLTGKKRILK
jgi:type I restriction enzyme, S subunit